MENKNFLSRIPWVFVGLGFIFGPLGTVLLVAKIFGLVLDGIMSGSAPAAKSTTTYTPPRPQHTRQNARVNEMRRSATDVAYHPVVTPRQKLEWAFPAKKGKLMCTMGGIGLALGAFISVIVMIVSLIDGGGLLNSAMISLLVAVILCAPTAALFAVGGSRSARTRRIRRLFDVVGDSHSADIHELAAIIGANYQQTVSDLQEMIDGGFLPGFFIDKSRGILTDDYQSIRRKKAHAPVRKQDGKYAEERRIRELNDEIEDAYVSERMDKLETLTHNIFEYLEAHPGKEAQVRQFRNHYLPTTLKILESYAQFEKQGGSGENVNAAMEEIEKIMDKLVDGFEKQLDTLFDDQVMDVTTDINVLKNMMDMSGLAEGDFKL